ncbi:hypothetical protein CEXT_769261 [Caerostris extrusa]|uniref:Uncharacterized protein n=1 Tax=Caerostris extrusa TaxID=172846 RepID=A0AAV4RT30_CAEEX|nr:hypothetical protein CEXT_769261 [Caerostris extrusa]
MNLLPICNSSDLRSKCSALHKQLRDIVKTELNRIQFIKYLINMTLHHLLQRLYEINQYSKCSRVGYNSTAITPACHQVGLIKTPHFHSEKHVYRIYYSSHGCEAVNLEREEYRNINQVMVQLP